MSNSTCEIILLNFTPIYWTYSKVWPRMELVFFFFFFYISGSTCNQIKKDFLFASQSKLFPPHPCKEWKTDSQATKIWTEKHKLIPDKSSFLLWWANKWLAHRVYTHTTALPWIIVCIKVSKLISLFTWVRGPGIIICEGEGETRRRRRSKVRRVCFVCVCPGDV